jgi:lipoprotein-anchoring transpeptidase ErfK/SrfK
LNDGVHFAAGETVRVPNVERFAPPPYSGARRPEDTPKTAAMRIVVDKETSSLTAFDEQGKPILHAPVTTGSEHDPLPIGEWKVTEVYYLPQFNYNPELFWDAEPTHSKAKIAPGPNNPVGVVWIEIDKAHYGLHGTPEPSKVGHLSSHGCVRLTNWDVLRVAALVRRDTPVIFQ